MTGPAEGLEVGDLSVVARVLADATDSSTGLAEKAPDSPDAGVSSPNIANFLVQLATAMQEATVAIASMADAVEAARRGYEGADRQSEESISRIDIVEEHR